MNDLRFASRQSLKNPSFTAVAVLGSGCASIRANSRPTCPASTAFQRTPIQTTIERKSREDQNPKPECGRCHSHLLHLFVQRADANTRPEGCARWKGMEGQHRRDETR